MTIDKQELFERIRALWPSTVERLALAAVYNAVEEATPEGDHWREVGAWAFHQALFGVASSRPGDQHAPVHTDAVTFEEFDHCVRSNLSDPSWASEREEYEAS